jgi:two-component system KDP operon response regulator KdpE
VNSESETKWHGSGTNASGAIIVYGSSNSFEKKLLVIDSDASVRRQLHGSLYSAGFDVVEVGGEEQAIALCRVVRCDGVLLAVNTPGKSGIETSGELRRLLPDAAILLLGCDDDETRVEEALEAGFDDYVAKPLRIRELIARIRAALRRVRPEKVQSQQIIVIGEVTLDAARRVVHMRDCRVHLTPKELSLLHYLMKHAGVPVPHTRLLRNVWGDDYTQEIEYLRTFIRQLRRKLGDDGRSPRYLLTDSHFGYRFADS